MMGLSPTDLNAMSWWEYQALLWTWNERHGDGKDEQVEAPDAAFVDRMFERLGEAGLVSVH